MKKVLITGANSYIGTSFEKYVKKYEDICVDTLDLLNKKWYSCDFSKYDVVFHVAGIAHIKETKENEKLYYAVNRDLTIKVAEKSKKSGVKHFVVLSSMSVYGILKGRIDGNSIPTPVSNYGKSKLEADNSILKMADQTFKVSVLRPPMVYGCNCKGNYQSLRKFVLKTCFFVKTSNKRSMIFIDNLCEFVYQIIKRESEGVFFPQNKEYVSTDNMIFQIAKIQNKKILFFPFVSGFLKKLRIKNFQKIFCDLVYEKIDYGFDYNIVPIFEDTIKKTEEKI